MLSIDKIKSIDNQKCEEEILLKESKLLKKNIRQFTVKA